MKKHIFWKNAFLILSGLVVSVIFGHSLMSKAASREESAMVVGTVQQVLTQIHVEAVSFPLHAFVRKMAHFIEFSALGVCIGGYAVNLGLIRGRKYIALPAFLTLLIAVSDEYIQTFSGRGGLVTDIVIDYSGAVFGLLLAAGYVLLRKLIIKKKEQKA